MSEDQETFESAGPDSQAAANDEARRRQVGAVLDHLFRRAGEGRETRQLYEAVLQYRLEQGR